MKMVFPMELYEASRELCLRLYVLNGGNPADTWRIKPYPGTAAISCKDHSSMREWTLCMPAFPMNVKLPRWKADLVSAYTVHELLHSLWTDWPTVKQTRVEGLHNLCNAIEDCRIEARASRGDLVQVSEARRLLEALNEHIAKRALMTPGFSLADPAQFSFVLGLVIFAEKLGYTSELPHDWKAHVRPEWFPLFKLALDRFDALNSTMDVLQLARDLKALAASLPKAKPQPRPRGNPPSFPMSFSQIPPRDAEIVEDAPKPSQDPQKGKDGQGEGKEQKDPSKSEDPPKGKLEASKGEDDERAPREFDQELDAGNDPEGDALTEENWREEGADAQGEDEDASLDPVSDAPRKGEGDKGESEGQASEQGDGAGNNQTDDRALPEYENEGEDAASELDDATQTYSEASLNDLAEQAAKEANASQWQVQSDASDADTILNAPRLREYEPAGGGNPARVSAVIQSPAKLRRHLTLAVKSPERVSKDRFQTSGRLDMRNLVGLSIGSLSVFTRRIEDEGREAAVSLLIDVSGSMAGQPLQCAKALALHMGDALKAAGVKFEIAAFDDRFLVTPKPMAKAWNKETTRAVAGLKCLAGTAMLPAIRQAAERLIKTPNVTRRILMVLTDGQDSYNATANAAHNAHLRRRGVEVIGLALYAPRLERTFNGAVVNVSDVRQLSAQGLASLVKTLDAGAPRSA
jgi:uncharacterized protein with von Willebrand factor type A (vWA) domain